MNKFFKELMKPDKPFDEWAKEHNIVINQPKIEEKKPFFKRRFVKYATVAATSIALILAIILPIAFLFWNNDTETVPKNITYSSQDIHTEYMELSEFLLMENLIFFPQEQIFQVESINKDIPNDNDSLIVSYFLSNAIILTSDETNAFFVDFRIRVYEEYYFYGYKSFENLSKTLEIEGREIAYNIENIYENINAAYIKFSTDSKDYFLTVRGFEGVTEINDDTIEILLRDLFSFQRSIGL